MRFGILNGLQANRVKSNVEASVRSFEESWHAIRSSLWFLTEYKVKEISAEQKTEVFEISGQL